MNKHTKYIAGAIALAILFVPALSFARGAAQATATSNAVVTRGEKAKTSVSTRSVRAVKPAASANPVVQTSQGTQPIGPTATTTVNADVNHDNIVDGADLAIVLGQWGDCPAEGECLGDVNVDQFVNELDINVILKYWGSTSPIILSSSAADFNGDDTVDGADLAMLLGNWGPCASLSDSSCVGDINGDGIVSEGDTGLLLKFWGPLN